MEFSKHISDILIIGGGGAAAMAALPPSRRGAKVTLISKESSFVGGATIMSAGGTCAVFKPNDSPETFYNDIMRGGGYLNNPRLARILAERSTQAIPSQYFFMGGIPINEKCETGLPGLFAVGEVSGGVHGTNRLSGSALTEVFVFGDLFGQNVMSWVEKEDLIPPRKSEVQEAIDQLEEIFSRQKGGVRPYQIKQAIKNIMWDYFGPSRNEEGMKKGLAGLKHIQENNIPILALGSRQAKYNREKMEAVEACLMLKTAILVATAALNRTESRGSHYRTDFPSSDDKHWLRNTVLRKSAEGEVDISYRQAGI